MGMTVGNRAGQRAEINVTPMIDVLLVLIIIFMVITPTSYRGLKALVPQQAPDSATPLPPSLDIVVSVAKDRNITINEQPVAFEALSQRLTTLFHNASGNHFFVRGDRGLDYREVAEVIDIARGAGWDRIGLMTR
jgi:biopolymer transport protein ExbD